MLVQVISIRGTKNVTVTVSALKAAVIEKIWCTIDSHYFTYTLH